MHIRTSEAIGGLSIAVLISLAILSPGQEPNGELAMLVTQDSEHRNVVSFRTTASSEHVQIVAAYIFDSPKGFLGPSSNPSDQNGFKNAENTLFGVNYQPATKSSFVYLFSKTKSSDLLFMRDINPRVASLLPKPWSETARSFLRIENMLDRRLNLQTVNFSGSSTQSLEFYVEVDDEGRITLSK